jgi:hypothetical protein
MTAIRTRKHSQPHTISMKSRSGSHITRIETEFLYYVKNICRHMAVCGSISIAFTVIPSTITAIPTRERSKPHNGLYPQKGYMSHHQIEITVL